MFERFTDSARKLVVEAQREARELEHARIGAEHLLLALLTEPEAPGAATLVRLGITADSCRQAVASLVRRGGGELDDEDGQALRALGIDLDEVRRKAENVFGEGALDGRLESGADARAGRNLFRRRKGPGGRTRGHIPFATSAKKALESSVREAVARKDRSIGTEHVTLALLRSEDTMRTFQHLGVEPQAAYEQVMADLSRAA